MPLIKAKSRYSGSYKMKRVSFKLGESFVVSDEKAAFLMRDSPQTFEIVSPLVKATVATTAQNKATVATTAQNKDEKKLKRNRRKRGS